MIVLGSASHAQKQRRPIDVRGDTYFKSEWLESGQDPLLSPTIFLVEQPPNTSLHGHFHGENSSRFLFAAKAVLARMPYNRSAFTMQALTPAMGP